MLHHGVNFSMHVIAVAGQTVTEARVCWMSRDDTGMLAVNDIFEDRLHS